MLKSKLPFIHTSHVGTMSLLGQSTAWSPLSNLLQEYSILQPYFHSQKGILTIYINTVLK